jgi:hypothetical protein
MKLIKMVLLISVFLSILTKVHRRRTKLCIFSSKAHCLYDVFTSSGKNNCKNYQDYFTTKAINDIMGTEHVSGKCSLNCDPKPWANSWESLESLADESITTKFKILKSGDSEDEAKTEAARRFVRNIVRKPWAVQCN